MTSWLHAPAVEVVPSGPVSTALRAPGSKSLTNRALLVAALAAGRSRLHDPLVSSDTQAMTRAVRDLGATVTAVDGGLVVSGTDGMITVPAHPINAALSGTTMRFVAAIAALCAEPVTITGEPPLLARPIGPLTAALRSLGAQAEDHDGLPPLTVSGGLRGGAATIDVTASSQYVSAVLLASPYARSDVTVTASGASAEAYVAMTVDVMNRWGAQAAPTAPGRWTVTAGWGYRPRDEVVEYDASAAGHLFALAAATGGSVTVTNVAPATLQPDGRIVDVLAAFGCTVTEEEGAVSVAGPASLTPVTVDLSAMPDQVTTVAALAALAPGTSVITGVGVTRGHETDRLAALANELTKLGAVVAEQPDGLIVDGGTHERPVELATYNDHRLAMAFAAIGAARPGVTIADPGCVAKTYPGFWDAVSAGGVTLRAPA